MANETMKKFNTKLLLVSLILATITSYVAYNYLKKIEEASIEGPKYIKIIVANVNIPERTKIDQSMIKEIEVDEVSYLSNSLQKKEDIIGMFTKEKILEGELIPKERLMEENKEDLSLRVPTGKRAISVSINEISGVGDLIKPGDYVDVYVTVDEYYIDGRNNKIIYPQITKLLLQDIQVLAISKEMERTDEQRIETPMAYSVAVAVDPLQGEKLVHGEDLGRLKLSLRPLKDRDIHDTSGTIRGDIVPDKGKLTIQK